MTQPNNQDALLGWQSCPQWSCRHHQDCMYMDCMSDARTPSDAVETRAPVGEVAAWLYSYPGATPNVSLTKLPYGTTWTETALYRGPPAIRAPVGEVVQVRVSDLHDMAKAYGLGSAEARAIITACEHASIVYAAPPATAINAELLAAAIIQDVCELPDDQSPNDPDLLQCMVEELTIILERHIARAKGGGKCDAPHRPGC